MGFFKARRPIVSSSPPAPAVSTGFVPPKAIVVGCEAAIALGLGLGAVICPSAIPSPVTPPKPAIISTESAVPETGRAISLVGAPPHVSAQTKPRGAAIVNSEAPQPHAGEALSRITPVDAAVQQPPAPTPIIARSESQVPQVGGVISCASRLRNELIRSQFIVIAVTESQLPYPGAVISRSPRVHAEAQCPPVGSLIVAEAPPTHRGEVIHCHAAVPTAARPAWANEQVIVSEARPPEPGHALQAARGGVDTSAVATLGAWSRTLIVSANPPDPDAGLVVSRFAGVGVEIVLPLGVPGTAAAAAYTGKTVAVAFSGSTVGVTRN